MTFGEYATDQAKNNLAIELEAQKQYIKESLDDLEPHEIEIVHDLVHKMMEKKI